MESRIDDWAFQQDYAQRILRNSSASRNSLASASTVIRTLSRRPAPSYITFAKMLPGFQGLANRQDGTESNGSAGYSGAPTLEALRHLDRVRFYEQHDSLVLDPVSVRNLELLTPIFSDDSGKNTPTTLVAALDVTVTGMGARLLRSWILRPLIDRNAIEERLDAVAHFVQQTVVRGEIRKELRGIQDLERLTSRITLGQAGPRELVALRKSLSQLPVLRNFVTPAPTGGSALLRRSAR